jgi:hypothetical protein
MGSLRTIKSQSDHVCFGKSYTSVCPCLTCNEETRCKKLSAIRKRIAWKSLENAEQTTWVVFGDLEVKAKKKRNKKGKTVSATFGGTKTAPVGDAI